MLSILIPIYNFDVRLLVAELYEQMNEMHVDFEIRCYDDGSYFDFRMNNQRIAAYPNVIYRELPENVGRSKIRNKLAAEAKYEYILFLDCDSQCGSTTFVKKYLDAKDPQTVVCGGRRYNEERPTDPQLILHWKYGIERETIQIESLVKKPYRNFMSNSFLIPKSIFEEIKFDESLTGYGHEDTLFGIDLKKKHVPVKYIHNPIYHLGLKSTHHFLESAHEAVKNLAYLIKSGKVDKNISLFKAWRTVSFLGLQNKIFKKLDKNRNYYVNQLYSSEPELKNLDKLKLLWLMEEMKTN